MTQQVNRALAAARVTRQQHHIGKVITTPIYGRDVSGRIVAIHPFGTVDIETANGNRFRVSGVYLPQA